MEVTTFRKNVDLPLDEKEDLEVMAIVEGHGNLKKMIQNIISKELRRFKAKKQQNDQRS